MGACPDIGKLAMPGTLNKPGKLTDSEWEAREDPPAGRSHLIRDSSARCPLVHAVVLRHHER
jgi:HD-GYP domain-containing protein (c-di-GMP phosphodiesterase class II)